ncbi:MAG: response regulator [Pseudohaliea sp.]
MSPKGNPLQALQRRFAEELPDRLAELRVLHRELAPPAWQPAAARTLHHRLHSLTGSAGTFGLPSLSSAARQVEQGLKAMLEAGTQPDDATWAALGEALARLERLAADTLQERAPTLPPPAARQHSERRPLISLLETDREEARQLATALRGVGYRVRLFNDPGALSTALAGKERPDAVVVTMDAPGSDTAGVELLGALKTTREDCPPLVVTSTSDDLELRLAACRAGACRYLRKPFMPAVLIDLLDAFTERVPAEPYRVLLVDDDPLLLEAGAAALRAAGMTVRAVEEPRDTLRALEDFRPDALVLDIYMPDISGLELAALVRDSDDFPDLPILFLSAETDSDQQLLALNLGGDDFLTKPVSSEHLVSAVTARARRARQSAAVQRRLELTLYEREREHLALNRHALVSATDAAGRITYANEMFCRVSGYRLDELLGQNHRIVKSGEHPPAFYRDLWRTIAGGKVWQGVLCNRRKSGEPYWVESTITPFLDEDGRPYQYVSIRTDITERRLAELALGERERQLVEAQRLASIGSWTADFASRELAWSDEVYRIFGHEPGGFTPTFEVFEAAVHPDDRAQVRENERLAAASGYRDQIYRITRPDGSIRHLHERARMDRDAEGRPLRLTGTVQDVSERVEFEQTLVAALRAADEANQAKSAFLSSMSHELRTPMNAILGFGQLLAYDEKLDGEQRESVDEMLKAGHHLLELINEVLDLAKVESGRMELSIEAVDLGPVVDECLALVGPQAALRGITVAREGTEGAVVQADRMRLKQALLNLLSNAVKYNREDGTVRLAADADGEGRLRIRVTDSGRGIPAEKLPELFQPFNRLGAESTGIEGTGVGLSITRHLVEIMGGTVDVESEAGVGSSFWIDLPAGAPPPATVQADTATAEVAATSAEADADSSPTLLYIEDNPANLRMVAQLLEQRPPLRLLTASTPARGIELALGQQPDLILLDINLPTMDGYQVLEVFKASDSLRNVPVVALTANAIPRDIERGMASGFSDYLTKPLDVPRFVETVNRYLGESAP